MWHLHLTYTCQLPKSISCVPFFNPFSVDPRVTILTISLSISLIPFTTPANIHLYIHWCCECCLHRHMVSNPSCNSALSFCVSQEGLGSFTILHQSCASLSAKDITSMFYITGKNTEHSNVNHVFSHGFVWPMQQLDR